MSAEQIHGRTDETNLRRPVAENQRHLTSGDARTRIRRFPSADFPTNSEASR